MQQWRLIDSGVESAQWNMAVDEALLLAFSEYDLPILRLYRWKEPALSFGRFSKVQETMNWERVRKEKISCVRRMTGGGILVHGGDLSYALIVPRTFVEERGVKESYHDLCMFLIRLYQYLGLDAVFAQDLKLTPEHTPVCLAGKEAYDMIIGGRKIGGNAQRHTHHAMLQHGTIPLTIDRHCFEPLFREDSGLEEAATLAETGIDMEALRGLLLEAFIETFNAVITEDSLHDDEYTLAQKLYESKYRKESWNVHAKSPAIQT